MKHLKFTWGPAKAESNEHKHGVSFGEACSVFWDEWARLIADPDHAKQKDRFALLGLSGRMRLLVVSHVFRRGSEEICLISARTATVQECQQYRLWKYS